MLYCLYSNPVLAAKTTMELVDALEASLDTRSVDEIKNLRYTKGEPEELAKPLFKMLDLVKDESLHATKPVIHAAKDYKPRVDLPGIYQGRKLDHLVIPSHWIVFKLSTLEGANPKFSVDVILPVAKVDDKWQIIGTKFSTN